MELGLRLDVPDEEAPLLRISGEDRREGDPGGSCIHLSLFRRLKELALSFVVISYLMWYLCKRNLSSWFR